MGGDGNDQIISNAGDDVLSGGSGDDVLNGNLDNDTLIGGAGNDFILGGDGADVFVFVQGDGFDQIADFEAGTDSINLSDYDFDSFDQLNLVEQNNTVFIFLDENNSVELNGVNDIDDLSEADFIL